MNDNQATRRAFLRQAVLASGGAWLAGGLAPVLAAAEAVAANPAGPWRTLTVAEVSALDALADAIWPPDDTPGAAAIGVVRFMDQAMASFMAGALPLVRDGLADLDGRARGLGAAGFAVLAPEQRGQLLADLQDGAFFGTVRFLTLCGLFALPSQGGNEGGAGWAEIGFEARHAWAPPFGAYDAAYVQENGHGD